METKGHQSASHTDALGRTAYTQRYAGASQQPVGSGITSYAVSQLFYDGGEPAAQGGGSRWQRDDVHPGRGGAADWRERSRSGGVELCAGPGWQLHPAGGCTGANGGTTYAFYDGLDRLTTLSTDAQGYTPLATYRYDQQAACPSSSTSYPIGRLCQEQFWSGPSRGVNGTYTYAYDLRGRTYGTTFTLSALAGSYSLSANYDDADRVTQLNYPAAGNLEAEFVSLNYDNTRGGGRATVSSNIASPTTLLAHNLTYSVQGWLTGWVSGSDAPIQAGFIQSQDGDGRLANRQLTMTPQGGQVANVAQVQPSYDAVGDVASLTTTLGAIPGVAGSCARTCAADTTVQPKRARNVVRQESSEGG